MRRKTIGKLKAFRKNALKVLKYTFFAGLIGVFGLEICFRIIFAEQLDTQVYPLIYQPDDSLGYRYIKDIEAKISIPGIRKEFKLNNQGFYGPDFEVHKKPGTIRVAVLGSSDASGIWLKSEKTFAMYLQEYFAKSGYKNIEVLNFSIDGRNRSNFDMRQIKHEIVKFSPNIMLYSTGIPFVVTDVRRDIYKGFVMVYAPTSESKQLAEAKIDYILRHKFLTTVYDASYIVRALARYYANHYNDIKSRNIKIYSRKRIETGGIHFKPTSVYKTVLALQQVKSKLNAIDCHFVLFNYFENERYLETAARHGFEAFTLDFPVHKPEYFHELDAHFNDKGHAFIGKRLYDEIIERNLLNRKVEIPEQDTLSEEVVQPTESI